MGVQNGFIPWPGRFTTFAEWNTAMKIQLQFETSETPGVVNIRGNLAGAPVWSSASGNWIEGVNLAVGGGTVTSTQTFDQPPYLVSKPQTNGRVFMYTIDSNNNSTLVAIYQPGELLPGWRRYKVPACSSWTAAAPGYFVGVCKLQYNPVINVNDEIIPGYIGALRYGLEALVAEDARNFGLADELWAMGKKMLCDQVNDDDGPGAQGVVVIEDDFAMSEMGEDY